MGRDALKGGVLRVVRDHRSPQGMRVTAYMRGLVADFIPKPWPFGRADGPDEVPTKPPAFIREQARTAGRLLLEEETLLAALAEPHKGAARRRLERRLLQTRSLRLKIEKMLQERGKAQRHGR
jgi:hypothetical protein